MALEMTLVQHVRRAPADVWPLLADLDQCVEWMPGLVRMERTAGPPGALVVGTVFRETRRMFGKEATEEFTCTGVEPGRAMTLEIDGTKGTSGSGRYVFRYDLAADGAGSVITLHGRIEMPGFFANLMGKLFAGQFRSAIAKDLAAFAAWAETA